MVKKKGKLMSPRTSPVVRSILVAVFAAALAGCGTFSETFGLDVANATSKVALEPHDFRLRVLRLQYYVTAFTRLGIARIDQYSSNKLGDYLRLYSALTGVEEDINKLIAALPPDKDLIDVGETFHTQYVDAQIHLFELMRAAVTPGVIHLAGTVQQIIMKEPNPKEIAKTVENLATDLMYEGAYHEDFDELACWFGPAILSDQEMQGKERAKRATTFCSDAKVYTRVPKGTDSLWADAWKGINERLTDGVDTLKKRVKALNGQYSLPTFSPAKPSS